MNFDQRTIEDLLQLLNQGDIQERQQIVPIERLNELLTPNNTDNSDIIGNNDVPAYLSDAVEVDPNANRNEVREGTFGADEAW